MCMTLCVCMITYYVFSTSEKKTKQKANKKTKLKYKKKAETLWSRLPKVPGHDARSAAHVGTLWSRVVDTRDQRTPPLVPTLSSRVQKRD